MIDPVTYAIFVAASLALILVPGPAQALVLASTLTGGRSASARTAIGLSIGTMFHAAAAGLSTLLATSALAFSIVKYLGAAYLLFMGLQALRAKTVCPSRKQTMASSASPLTKVIFAGCLNPKVALFFLAFLPPVRRSGPRISGGAIPHLGRNHGGTGHGL